MLIFKGKKQQPQLAVALLMQPGAFFDWGDTKLMETIFRVELFADLMCVVRVVLGRLGPEREPAAQRDTDSAELHGPLLDGAQNCSLPKLQGRGGQAFVL